MMALYILAFRTKDFRMDINERIKRMILRNFM